MEHPLAAHRRRLDGLDEELLDLLRRRLELCIEIADIKASCDIPMMQPGRVGVVLDRARRFAVDHGMSPEYTEGLFRDIVAETCRVEDLVMGAGADGRADSRTDSRTDSRAGVTS